MLGYILMAVIGGMMGALFNSIVEHLNHRAHHIHKSAVKRMLEVVVALLTGTAVIYLPMSAPCSIAGIVMRDSAGCLSDDDYAQISHGWLSEKYAALSGNSILACRQAT